MRLKILLLTVLIGSSLYLPAQPPTFPENYFRNPLGIPMQLSANFGELRPNHWHMGLDIRTEAKENLPVYAAAEGYVAQVGIRPQSFGRFIIINHPNGLSTLYAHLNDFYPELEAYVTTQQYKQQSWAVELNFEKNQFPLSKGSFIAYSGNTGGSRGPHLHFEIIDTKTGKRLNPLLFNFPVVDNLPPSIMKLAMYDRSQSVFAQSPVIYNLKKSDSGYIIPKIPIIKTGLNKVSFAIQAYDIMNGGGSKNGIYSAKLYLDDEPQVSFILDSIDYEETLYMNAQIDYRIDYKGGIYLQHLSALPGDSGPVYKKIRGDGVISLSDTNLHQLSIDVKDPNGNSALLNFAIQHDDSLVKADNYQNYSAIFTPGQLNKIEKDDFKIHIPENCLYDTVPAYYNRSASSSYNVVTAMHIVNDPSYPLQEDITVSIRPTKSIPEEWKEKLIMLRTGRGNTIRKVSLHNGWFSAKFGGFGSFQVIADVAPPQINQLGKGDTINLSAVKRIIFSPTDNYGIVKNFRVELDSQWLRFTNDKGRNWIYKFDERCSFGIHQLTATATDLAGNVTTKTWWFKRYPYTPPPPKKKIIKKAGTKKKEIKDSKKKTTSVKKIIPKKK